MYSRSNNNFGVNTSISLDPSSSSQTSQSITNNIIVRAATGEDNLPLVERSIEITDNKSEQEIQEEKLRFDEILLDVYKSILLTQNKVLLTNILSKKHIIIYKTDLEKVYGLIKGFDVTKSTKIKGLTLDNSKYFPSGLLIIKAVLDNFDKEEFSNEIIDELSVRLSKEMKEYLDKKL